VRAVVIVEEPASAARLTALPLTGVPFASSNVTLIVDPPVALASTDGGLAAVDVANPAQPKLLATLLFDTSQKAGEVFEILIQKVHDYEGSVNELTGDGIMALFGAPIALEDAPQRAIRSALAIHHEMSKFSDKLKIEKRIPPIKMRIGIHTGPVIVGTLGKI
jgi:hypothetical protein